MTTNEAGAVIVRFPEWREGETRARYQQRLGQWRARKGWRPQLDAQHAEPPQDGSRAAWGAA